MEKAARQAGDSPGSEAAAEQWPLNALRSPTWSFGPRVNPGMHTQTGGQ